MTVSIPAHLDISTHSRPTHSWLRPLNVVFMPEGRDSIPTGDLSAVPARPRANSTFAQGAADPVLEEVIAGLRQHFQRMGHQVQPQANDDTDLVFTTGQFGQPIGWRDSLLFAGRRHLRISHAPAIYTLVHVTPETLQEKLDYFEKVLVKEPPDPEDFEFPGLVPQAYHTLVEQGRRGGPIMALERLMQAQLKSIRILLVVGHDRPEFAHI